MRFQDIKGHDELKKQLIRQVESGRVSHAQLLSGAAGRGGLAIAVAYAQYLNCEHRKDGDSCGVCANCVQIQQLAHPDLHLVFPVNKQNKKSGEVVISDDFVAQFRQLFLSTNGLFSAAQWRDKLNLGKTLKAIINAKESNNIVEKLSFKSFAAPYKVMIIWLPETMNDEAANKLLKILEEPWERTIFLLVSERPDKLLKTISSRVQEIEVPPLEVEILEQEALNLGVGDISTARNMARLATGDMLRLRELASDDNEGENDYFALFCQLMRLSYNDKHLELMEWADEVAAMTREQQIEFLRDCVRLLRESYMLHAGLGSISYLWGEESAFCKKFAPFIGNQNIEPIVENIERAIAQLSQNGNSTIIFTHFALSVSKHINRL